MERKINRIKVMLAEKGKTNKWLSEQVGKDPATVSKWCTNMAQPTLETMMQISKVLECSIDDLVRFEALPEIEKKSKNLQIVRPCPTIWKNLRFNLHPKTFSV